MFQEPFFVFLFTLGFILIAYLLYRNITQFHFDSLESFTSLSASRKKMRILSVLAILLFPSIAFYETEILELYNSHWLIVGCIVLFSSIAFALSFNKKLTLSASKWITHLVYALVYSAALSIAFLEGLTTTLAFETALLILFAKVIYLNLRPTLYFFVFSLFLNAFMVLLFQPEESNLTLYLSASIQCWLVVAIVMLIEGNVVNNQVFASQILNNSNLFILVSDREGNIVYVSDYLLKRTGCVESELLGQGWWDYRKLQGRERKSAIRAVTEVIDGKSSEKYINRIDTGAELIDIEWIDHAIENNFVMGIGKDVSKELKFRQETEMLSQVATSVTNGVIITNPFDEVQWVNKPFLKITGYKEEELIGRDPLALIQPFDLESEQHWEHSKSMELKKPHRLIFKNGAPKQKHALVNISAIYNDQQHLINKVQVWTDVSKQQLLEQRYGDVINNAFDNIYTTNAKGEFTYVNKAMIENMGYPEEEILGQHYTKFVHPDYREQTVKFYKEQFRKGQTNSYYEFLAIGKDKQERWVGQNVKFVFDPVNKSRVIELHAVARDITEIKKNRDELLRLSMVAQRSTSIVMILDHRNRIDWVNDAFTKVFGYNLSEVQGKAPGELLYGEQTDHHTVQKIDYLLKHKEPIQTELIHYDKYGKPKWIEISMDPIFDEKGALINYIAVENDISDRKAQESLISKQHNDIIESLEYSSRIQGATIPSLDQVKKVARDAFVIYQPKEIIGGDFYQVDKVLSNDDFELDIYIVADCTGHGIPGAMLSVLCNSILKEAIVDRNVNSPADVLEYARDKLNEFLQYKNERMIYDGMDVCLVAIDRTHGKLHFSGANRPLYLIRDEELITIKGDRQSVGYSRSPNPFTDHEMDFKSGDKLYLFTDGMVDQFGGEEKRKFMSRRFQELLLATCKQSMARQRLSILKTLIDWQGDLNQTDDMCLMAILL